MKKQKLFKARFPQAPKSEWFSSSDKHVYILATEIESATAKATKELKRINQERGENQPELYFESISLASETVL